MKTQRKSRDVVLPTAPKPDRSEPRLFDIARMAAAFRDRRSRDTDPDQKLKSSA